MITSAKNEGFRLEFPSKKIGDFYSLLLAHHHRQGIPCVSKKWVEDLVSSSMYELALVYCINRLVAGTMLPRDGIFGKEGTQAPYFQQMLAFFAENCRDETWSRHCASISMTDIRFIRIMVYSTLQERNPHEQNWSGICFKFQ